MWRGSFGAIAEGLLPGVAMTPHDGGPGQPSAQAAIYWFSSQ